MCLCCQQYSLPKSHFSLNSSTWQDLLSESFLSLFCWYKGKDGVRSPDRVCGEEGSPRNWHQGEEPLQLPLSGPPSGLQAVAAGNHRRGAPSSGGHELQRVCWLPDRPAQQGIFRTERTFLKSMSYLWWVGKLEDIWGKCLVLFLRPDMLMCSQDVKPQAYRNAYDIPRRNLLDQLTRMRSNLLRTSQKLIRGQDEGIKSYI